MNVLVDFTAGTTIDEALAEAIEFSRKNNCFVDFTFNGIPMNVCALRGIDHREADIEVYKKMYHSMRELPSCKKQKDEEKHDLDEQLTKLAKAMTLVDEAYKWFHETNWDKLATEDCMAIQRKIGQLISDINDIQKLKEEQE